MRDPTLIEPFAVQEIFVDGFTEHALHNGVMTCVGYRLQPPSHQHGEMIKVVVLKLVWPAASTNEAITDARQAMTVPSFSGVQNDRLKTN